MSCTLHTSVGDLTFELFCRHAPIASYNFLALAASGFYSNTCFSRVIASFIMQGGAPLPGDKSKPQTIFLPSSSPTNVSSPPVSFSLPDELDSSFTHARGTLAMVNKPGQNNSACSQFYITFAPRNDLDGKNTIFGQITQGFDILEQCEHVPVKAKKFTPEVPILIHSVTIHMNPFALGELDTPQFFKTLTMNLEQQRQLQLDDDDDNKDNNE